MYRIDNANAVAVAPATPGAGAQGYFTNGNPPVTAPTEVEDWWLNMVQEELVGIAELGGGSLDKADNAQCGAVLEHILGIRASGSDTGTVTNDYPSAVLGSSSSKAANGSGAVVLSSSGVIADGTFSAVVSSLSVGGDGYVLGGGFRSLIAASSGTNGNEIENNGNESAVVACRSSGAGGPSTVQSTAFAAALIASGDATTGSSVDGQYNAVLASSGARVQHSGSEACAIIASTDCDAGGSGHSNNLVAASSGSSQANASQSAVIASSGGSLTSDDKTAIIASNDCVADGAESFIAASDEAETEYVNSAAIAVANTSAVRKPRSVIAASNYSELGVGSGSGNSTLLASTRCELVDDYTLALGYHATTTPSFDGATNKNLTIKFDGAGGDGYFDGGADVGSADYAELFESDGEIEPGRLVTLKNGKAQIAGASDDVLGVTTRAPSVLGNAAPLEWSGRYLLDEWGAPIVDELDFVRWKKSDEVDAFDGLVSAAPAEDKWPENAERYSMRVRRENPDYDSAAGYVPRKDRPEEWTKVGLLGQVRVAVTEDAKPGDLLKPSSGGVGAPATTKTKGRPVRIMSIARDYDSDDGFAIALCFVG